MNLTKGRIIKPLKVLVYGPEGIGKTTFASKFPEVVFIDTEHSTDHMDVMRFPTPQTWQELLMEVDDAIAHPDQLGTLAIDTVDWAERLCMDAILAENQWKSIETPGYGKGYTVLVEKFAKLLDKLSLLVDRGVNVVMTAHTAMRTVTLPEETGNYDRWELKLQKKTAPIVKEWADVILFANYKTLIYKDEKSGKNKASGGERVMYTQHHTCWDAKNRFGMLEELPFDYQYLAPIIPKKDEAEPAIPVDTAPDPVPQPPKQEPAPAPAGTALDRLRPLMRAANVSDAELEAAVAAQGFRPKGMPLADYDPELIDGLLIAQWPAVLETIKEMREIPF